MLVMVVFFIAFRWIHLSTPLIRLFLLVLILLLMPTLNFLPVWFALSLLRFRLPSRLPMMFILWMVAMMVVIIPSFFSSRRPHTSCLSDWSSDVCSSDLLTDSWGSPRPGGRAHQGIDIFAPRNTPIRSTTPGIVVTVGRNDLGGRIVRIFGPAGEWHYYAHLERFAEIHPGQLVAPGQILGYVGDSGNAQGPATHLHYGIYRWRGGAMDPYPRLHP